MNMGPAAAESVHADGRGAAIPAMGTRVAAAASPTSAATAGATADTITNTTATAPTTTTTTATATPTPTPTPTPTEAATPSRDHERVLAHTTARLLDACAGAAGSIGLLSAAAAVVALLEHGPGLLAAPGTVMFAIVLALLPLERFMGLRVRFDAGLFTDLAAELSRACGRADAALSTCAALDAALHALALRGPAAAPRPLIDRAHGARRLAIRHALVALAQFALLMSALWLRLLP
jgi:hypothetical protein